MAATSGQEQSKAGLEQGKVGQEMGEEGQEMGEEGQEIGIGFGHWQPSLLHTRSEVNKDNRTGMPSNIPGQSWLSPCVGNMAAIT